MQPEQPKLPKVKNDEVRCVVLVRKGRTWDFCHACLSKSKAWNSAHGIEEQMQLLGSRTEAVVVLGEDFDQGKIKVLRPPHGFVYDVPIGSDGKYVKVITEVEQGGFQPKKCPYCDNVIPSNGAAQFAHLRKHINELVKRGILTEEQGRAIRSTKLSPQMAKLFVESFKT